MLSQINLCLAVLHYFVMTYCELYEDIFENVKIYVEVTPKVIVTQNFPTKIKTYTFQKFNVKQL